MASWLPPLEPDEPEDEWVTNPLDVSGVQHFSIRRDPPYDPYAEQDKTPTERMYDEMNHGESLEDA